jgi:antitoxin component of MazEF toxin-antitoxin module
MPFVKKLARLGNSTAIIIDRPFLQQLDLAPDAEVEISVENNALVIRPHRYPTDEEFAASANRIVNKRRGLMKRLRDR